MTSLQPYRPTGSFFGMPQARKRSPISIISGVVIISLWIGTFFFFFAAADNFMGGFGVFGLFIGLFILTIAIPIGLNFGFKTLVKMRLGDAEITVNSPLIYRGADLTCEFTQPVKSQVAITGAKIKLIKHEWVKWQQGTDTRTETHNELIDEIEFEGGTKHSGEQIWYQAQFQIPHNAMHNINYSRNRIQWLVIVQVEIPFWPDFYEEYALDFRSNA